MPKRIELILLPEQAADETNYKQWVARKAGIPEKDIHYLKLVRRSIDARSKQAKFLLQFDLYLVGEQIPELVNKRKLQSVTGAPVVIVGCGPAGLFAALRLIELGIKPILIERGKNVKDRRRDLAVLNRERIVNPDSNYCFGEGGAGTYSDGKLYTRSDKRGNTRMVLDTFIEFGASPEIAIDSHPHIGTNKLPAVIEAMRNAIINCGGEILFGTKFTGLDYDSSGVKYVKCVRVDSGTIDKIPTRAIILATGHSARDIFEYFDREKIMIEAKALAIGIRIEHPQSLIDASQYHCTNRGEYLPAAAYTLSAQSNGKGVYSFCMCPGGIIAAAATAPGEVVVNGWSPSKRNNPFANSGIVVSVDHDDFKPYESAGALQALRFQQFIEQKAFVAGGSNLSAPAQRLVDFVENKTSATLPDCSYIPGISSVNLREVLTPSISNALAEGFTLFAKKIKGYYTNDAVLVATESRTSSPVKIPRDKDTLMHPRVSGLFPCGEGAGYAGGIMSAAMDGERCAESVATFLQH